jgi:hypothetical protein
MNVCTISGAVQCVAAAARKQGAHGRRVSRPAGAHTQWLARSGASTAAKRPPQEYRCVWQIWQIFRRHRLGEDGTPFNGAALS